MIVLLFLPIYSEYVDDSIPLSSLYTIFNGMYNVDAIL